jgi:hypothetical protein
VFVGTLVERGSRLHFRVNEPIKGGKLSVELEDSDRRHIHSALATSYRRPQRLPRYSAKHSKSFSLIDCISLGVDRMQQNFQPMRKQIEAWQKSELTDVTAKVVIYEAFVDGRLEAPKHPCPDRA